MAKFYLVKTFLGSSCYTKGSTITVGMRDGTFQPIKVEDAKRFAGKTTTIYDKKYIDEDPATIEANLMQIKEGPYSDFRKSKVALHDNVDGVYVPKFSVLLNRAHEESGSTLDYFVAEVHESLPELEFRGRKKKINEATIKRHWYTGDTVAPENWENFSGLMKLPYSTADDFSEFYEHFKAFESDVSNNQFFDNLFYSYIFYKSQKQKFGKKTSDVMGAADKERRTRKTKSRLNPAHGDKVNQYINDKYYGSLNERFSLPPLLDVVPVGENGNARSSNGRNGGMVRQGVYVIKKGDFDIDVPKKSESDMARDIAVLERTLLNRMFYSISDRDRDRNPEEVMYLTFLMEERIRGNSIYKGDLLDDPTIKDPKSRKDAKKTKAREMDKLSAEINKFFFLTQDANHYFGFKENTMQNLRDTYKSIAFFFPKDVEEYLNLRGNLKRMNLVDPPVVKKERERFNERKSKMEKRFREIAPAASAKHSSMGIKGLFTEATDELLWKLPRQEVTFEDVFAALRNNLKVFFAENGRDVFSAPYYEIRNLMKHKAYSEEDITRIFESFKLGELVKGDPEITMQKIFYRE